MNKYKVTYLIGYKTPWQREEVKIIEAENSVQAKKLAYSTAPFHLYHKFIKVRRLFNNEKIKVCRRSTKT